MTTNPPPSQQELVDLIRDSAAQGHRAQHIGRTLQLPTSQVRRLAKNHDIKVEKPNYEAQITTLRKLAQAGVYTTPELANELGLSIGTVRVYARDNQIPLPSKSDSHAIKLKRTLTQVEKPTLESLCTTLDITPQILHRVATRYDISLPENLGMYPHCPPMDAAIRAGDSLKEIGATVNKTKQAASIYVNTSGQHDLWQEKRSERQ